MALNRKLFTAIALNEYFVNKDSGEPLAGGTIEFFRDSDRNTNKLVYALSGTEPNYTYTSLGSTLTLNDSGQVVDGSNNPIAVYYYPYLGAPTDDPTDNTVDLYYVVCQGSDSSSQWTKQAVPNITAESDAVEEVEPANNQISNAQFTRTFFDNEGSMAYTVSGAIDTELDLAPNWDLIVSGTGTVTVTKTAVAGNSNYTTNPPFLLRIACGSGITKCELRQRFEPGSGLWSSTSASDADKRYLIAGLLARGITGDVPFQIFYEESTGAGAQSLLSDTAGSGSYVYYQSNDAVEIAQSTNTDTGDNGYIDIYLSITNPENKTVDVSSFQVLSVNSQIDTDTVTYERRSAAREQAYMGDYYIPALEAKTAESLLTGWDFGLNPAQWGTTATLSNAVSTGNYIWDQTIALDTAGSATVARDADTGGFQVTTVAAVQNSFCIAQYLDGEQARALTTGKFSVNLNAFRNGGGAVTARVYMYRATAAAAYPALGSAEFIATRATDGTLSSPFAGWTLMPRGGLGVPSCTLNAISTKADITSDNNNYGFTGWELTDATQIDDTDKFCIVVTFAYDTASTVVTVNDVSLVRGDIPCRSAPKTSDQVLQECEQYFQKSFNPGVTPAQGVGLNTGEVYMLASNTGAANNIMPCQSFSVPLITAPTITFFNPVSANAFMRDIRTPVDFSSTSVYGTASRKSFAVQGTGNAATFANYICAVHYTADARIGWRLVT